ncbi:MAG: hypothetical protein R3C26_20270 [Calditrichia bacterium]
MPVEALVGKSTAALRCQTAAQPSKVLARDEVVPDPDNWILKKD